MLIARPIGNVIMSGAPRGQVLALDVGTASGIHVGVEANRFEVDAPTSEEVTRIAAAPELPLPRTRQAIKEHGGYFAKRPETEITQLGDKLLREMPLGELMKFPERNLKDWAVEDLYAKELEKYEKIKAKALEDLEWCKASKSRTAQTRAARLRAEAAQAEQIAAEALKLESVTPAQELRILLGNAETVAAACREAGTPAQQKAADQKVKDLRAKLAEASVETDEVATQKTLAATVEELERWLALPHGKGNGAIDRSHAIAVGLKPIEARALDAFAAKDFEGVRAACAEIMTELSRPPQDRPGFWRNSHKGG